MENKHQLKVYLPQSLLGELLIVAPEIFDPVRKSFRYGKSSDLIASLLRRFIEERKGAVKV